MRFHVPKYGRLSRWGEKGRGDPVSKQGDSSLRRNNFCACEGERLCKSSFRVKEKNLKNFFKIPEFSFFDVRKENALCILPLNTDGQRQPPFREFGHRFRRWGSKRRFPAGARHDRFAGRAVLQWPHRRS